MNETRQEIKDILIELETKLPELIKHIDLDKTKAEIVGLEKTSQESGFWNDSQKAGQILSKLNSLREEVESISSFEVKILEAKELLELSENKEDFDSLLNFVEALKENFEKLEFKKLLSGEYDSSSAILAIHAGAGGVDAQDWSEMLLRMYLRWAELKGFKTKVIDESRGGEAGIKSVVVEIVGSFVYGYLKGEAGTHRLVRLSPFNSDNLRQTSFALVEVMPIVSEIKEVEINEKDLRINTFRSSGAGGQSVNTTDSAVRITHIPSGVVASCQNERSQLQNKEKAFELLKAKLHQQYLDKQEEEKRKLRGEYSSAEWGSQIRSYVLHPYKMVKDHRTKYETVDTERVLNGNIDDFIEAYLKMA